MAIFQPSKDLIVSMKVSSVWGTAVNCDAATCRLAVDKESFKFNPKPYVQNTLLGEALQRQDKVGGRGVTGSLILPFDFTNCIKPVALFFGTHSVPVQLSGAAYSATISINKNIEGIMATLAMAKNIDLEEYDSIKPESLELSGASDGAWMLTASYVGRERKWAGSADYASTTAALTGTTTFKDTTLPLAIWNLAANNVFRMNVQSAAALDSTMKFHPQDFKISFKRPLKIFTTSLNAPCVDEPRDNGHMQVEGSFTLPLFQAIALFEAAQSKTNYKMDITLQGDLITGAYYQKFVLSLPQVQFVSPTNNADGPETVGVKVDFKCTAATANPNGMSQAVPYIETQNIWAASPI